LLNTRAWRQAAKFILAPLLFRSGTFVGRLTAGFFVTRFLITARLFTTGFLAPMFMASLLFAGRRLDAAHGATERFDLALVVELLAFSQFNQLLDFFHLIERLFQGLDDTAHIVCGFGDSGTSVANRLLMDGWAVNRLPLNGWGFHRRHVRSRRFDGRGFGSSVRWRCLGRLIRCRRRCPGGRRTLATSTTATTTASAM
jgi:hypothetical protein